MPEQRVDGHLVHLGGLVAAGVAHARDEVVDALLVQGLHAVVVPGQVVRAVLLQQGLQVVDQVAGAAVIADRVAGVWIEKEYGSVRGRLVYTDIVIQSNV